MKLEYFDRPLVAGCRTQTPPNHFLDFLKTEKWNAWILLEAVVRLVHIQLFGADGCNTRKKLRVVSGNLLPIVEAQTLNDLTAQNCRNLRHFIFVQCQDAATLDLASILFTTRDSPQCTAKSISINQSINFNFTIKSLKSYQRGSAIKQCKGLTITRNHVPTKPTTPV